MKFSPQVITLLAEQAIQPVFGLSSLFGSGRNEGTHERLTVPPVPVPPVPVPPVPSHETDGKDKIEEENKEDEVEDSFADDDKGNGPNHKGYTKEEYRLICAFKIAQLDGTEPTDMKSKVFVRKDGTGFRPRRLDEYKVVPKFPVPIPFLLVRRTKEDGPFKACHSYEDKEPTLDAIESFLFSEPDKATIRGVEKFFSDNITGVNWDRFKEQNKVTIKAYMRMAKSIAKGPNGVAMMQARQVAELGKTLGSQITKLIESQALDRLHHKEQRESDRALFKEIHEKQSRDHQQTTDKMLAESKHTKKSMVTMVALLSGKKKRSSAGSSPDSTSSGGSMGSLLAGFMGRKKKAAAAAAVTPRVSTTKKPRGRVPGSAARTPAAAVEARAPPIRGFPKNRDEITDCGHCVNAWNSRMEFCKGRHAGEEANYMKPWSDDEDNEIEPSNLANLMEDEDDEAVEE